VTTGPSPAATSTRTKPHRLRPPGSYTKLGLALTVRDLPIVDWASPADPRPNDGGRLPADHRIHTDPDELDSFDFYHPDQCLDLLPPRIAPRIQASLTARAKGTSTYLLDGTPQAAAV